MFLRYVVCYLFVAVVQKSFSPKTTLVSLGDGTKGGYCAICPRPDQTIDPEEVVAEMEDLGYEAKYTKCQFLNVENITCTSCTDILEHVLNGMEGVLFAKVNLNGEGIVVGDVDGDTICAECDDVGYPCTIVKEALNGLVFDAFEEKPQQQEKKQEVAEKRKDETSIPIVEEGENEMYFSIEGMRCAACVSKIERSILNVTGVQTASVNLMGKTARVCSSFKNEDEIIETIKETGYTASSVSLGASTLVLKVEKESWKDFRNEIVAKLNKDCKGIVNVIVSQDDEITIVYESSTFMKPREAIQVLKSFDVER